MKCADCRWWDQTGSLPPVHNRCFRYPPVKIFDGEEAATQWPWTGPSEFCGEFTPIVGGATANTSHSDTTERTKA